MGVPGSYKFPPWCSDLQYADFHTSCLLASAGHQYPMTLTVVTIMGADGLAMQIKFQPQAAAYPTYM